MKTQEQIKSEVINYLENTSKHLFATKTDSLYKVILDKESDRFIVINGDRVSLYNIGDYIKWYGVNAKGVIKHIIFLNKELKSIKNFKAMRLKVDKIKSLIKSDMTKDSISKIILEIINSESIVG